MVATMSSNREAFQQRVYFYLTELRAFFAESPLDIRVGISEELLTQLAHVLADGSVFDLVTELAESQRLEEQALHKQLTELRADQSCERTALRQKHREERMLLAARPHHLPVLKKEQADEQKHLTKRQAEVLRTLLVHIVHSLDGRVIEQQTALERTGCSVFVRTTDPQQIRVQMRVLDWIMRLSQRPLPSELYRPSPLSDQWPS
ncbi:uncharacterized protein DEA37_0008639 [Paragonimus westermani]|uniref:Protein DGCR6 n=1 Tax=Paragonimus westermani TaxID=34504 RepID=A0A5J4P0F6_9TREM|nr:uncharacterized protein DEA37_0008639 [Paragonimus westermani]